MRVAVTGAGGFVGLHLIRCLKEAGHEAITTTLSDEAPVASRRNFRLDVTDARAVKSFAEEVRPDAVIHLAAQPSVPISWEKPQLTYEINLIGTVNLLEACKGTDTRLLLVGSCLQYLPPDPPRAIVESDPMEPTNPYAASKIAAEEAGWLYQRHHGVHVMVARSFNHTGPGQSTGYAIGSFAGQIAAIAKGIAPSKMHVGNLEARRDLLDVRDVVQAYRLLVEEGQEGQAYNVCSGEHVSMREALDMLLDEAGLLGSVEVVEDPLARPGDIPVLFGDPTKIHRSVGWGRQIALSTSLGDTLAWAIENVTSEDR